MDSLAELKNLEPYLQRLATVSQQKHARIDELRRELKRATGRAQKHDLEYKKHIIYYSRNQCLHMANMMQQRLPAELRHLIYEYLVVEDRPIPVGPYYHHRPYDQSIKDTPDLWGEVLERQGPDIPGYMDDGSEGADADGGWTHAHSPVSAEITERIQRLDLSWTNECVDLEDDNIITLPDGRVKEEHTHKPPSDIVLPSSYLLNPRYIGSAMSAEIQKVYYTQNTFSICSVQQAIRSFGSLHSGHFMQTWNDDGSPRKVPDDLKLQPPFYPSIHVRDLQVRVKCEQYHVDEPLLYLNSFGRYAYQQCFLRRTLSNITNLDLLLRRSSQSAMKIEFILMTRLPVTRDMHKTRMSMCAYINFLQCIRNMVYKLMYDHDKVRVKITHYDEGVSPFPRDLTDIFVLTREQWEHEKSVREGQGEHVANFYLGGGPWRNEEDMAHLYGYPGIELEQYIRERWGLNKPLDTTATHCIKEGRYWPRPI